MADGLENRSFCSNEEIFGYTKEDPTTKVRNKDATDCQEYIIPKPIED